MSASAPPPSRPDAVPREQASLPGQPPVPGPAPAQPAAPERRAPGPADGRLSNLIARATAHDGHPPFSDGSLVELRSGERRAVWLNDVAVALVAEREAEFVVDPSARRRGYGQELLHLLLMDAPGDLFVWAHGAHPGALALAARFGLQPVRQLLQLRLNLAEVANSAHPADETPAKLATSRTVTHGMRGHEDAWVELNARAFASHPEQGGVTRAELDALMSEAWFADDDVLLLWDDGALVGYSWMKVERDSAGSTTESGAANDVDDDADAADHLSPGGDIGEFYVVGVDPSRQGEGIGHVLVAAGLEHLRERGIPIAHLYVEGDNTAALRLYRSFGFHDHALDIQYRWRSDPDDPPLFRK